MSEKSGKSDIHKWTNAEDELLIRFMLELHEKGELVSENGLRSGVLNTLKDKLHEAIPGCLIQAHPHIQSRYKKLKAHYGVVTDLLNLSGFGWNSETKCVTAPKTVWDEYIKAHKGAGKLRNKSFPYYEEFSLIFNKDRAQGKESEQYDDAVEEINNHPGLDEHDDGDIHISHENNLQPEQTPDGHLPFEQTLDEQTPSSTSTGPKKRKRNSVNREDFLLQGMERIAHTLAEGFKDASERLAMYMNKDEREKRIEEREKRLDDMKDSLYNDIMQVEGLSDQQRDLAFIKLMSDEKLLTAFYSTPQEGKARVLRRMIA